MNKELIIGQQNFFNPTKQREIEKWVENVNQFNKKKSIYQLTWKGFYNELHQLGTKEFLWQYGFYSKEKLQLFIARSNLWQEKVTLKDFEKRNELELIRHLKNQFFSKVIRQPNFTPKGHKLSTIHYYIYHYNLNFAALSLGFPNKQSFLNFLAKTLHIIEPAESMARNLSKAIQLLSEVDPVVLRNEVPDFYDKPLTQNIHFVKFNATLEELKRALENENRAMVVASLGGYSVYFVNKKLQSLINISLHDFQQKSRAELEQERPSLSLLWGTKLNQISSGQVPVEQPPFILHMPQPLRLGTPFYWQFFSPRSSQALNKDLRLHTNATPLLTP